MPIKYTREKKKMFLKILEKTAGNISASCKQVGINRQTYYNWLNKDKKFKQEVDSIQEGLIDFAESMLMKKIKDGDTTSLIFFLKTKGKHRGWSEKLEVKHENQAPVINVIGVDVKND